MKLFIKTLFRFLLIGLVPLIILTIGYLYFDPFKVVRSYKDYSNSYVIPNRDFISTEMFFNNKDRYHYNSFIFGSSRTLAFRPGSWKKHLSPDAIPYMFDASGESIYGIYIKLRLLDSLNIPIRNALIIICRDASFEHDANHAGHLFIKAPRASGESKLDFQWQFYKAYMSPGFLYSFYYYTFSGKYKPHMKGYIEDRKIIFDTVTNEIYMPGQEEEITQTPAEYYTKRASLFYERNGVKADSLQRIQGNHVYILKEIKRILEKNKTNYRVVLSPLYDQVSFNAADISILTSLFGDNIYNFSGPNSFTELKTNYYETSHFRPHVGDSIMNIIYRQQSSQLFTHP